ncbi:MAG: carboxypeptidase-like regulatory domain-containing protein [Chitinophagales bacterium]
MPKIFTLLCISFFCYSTLSAQDREIKGVVRDEASDETIPGASVIVKEDNTIGTSTDIDGSFTLRIPESATAIIVRSVGYSETEVIIGNTTFLNIVLRPIDYNLDAVVISASRKQEKILDAPASISLITPEQIKNTVALTPIANLKGTPGVDIINTGLFQTNVVVRGFNNIFSGALLTMVDNRYAAVPSCA